jgi:ribosomal protein S18 acetylase RimI-like enzyme
VIGTKENSKSLYPFSSNSISFFSLSDTRVSSWQTLNYLRCLGESCDYIFIAIDNEVPDKIIGFIVGKKEKSEGSAIHGHITTLHVLSQFRRNGIALALMGAFHDELASSSISQPVNSSLNVKNNNYGAIKLYEKMGYECKEIRKCYYQDGIDGIYMELILK